MSQAFAIRERALRHRIAVDVEPTDLLVEIENRGRGDRAALEAREAVCDADISQGSQGS